MILSGDVCDGHEWQTHVLVIERDVDSVLENVDVCVPEVGELETRDETGEDGVDDLLVNDYVSGVNERETRVAASKSNVDDLLGNDDA